MNEAIIKALVNSQGETMEIHYKDGAIFEGFMSKVNPNYNPPQVVLTIIEGGDSHYVDFPRIQKLIIKQYGKEPVTLE